MEQEHDRIIQMQRRSPNYLSERPKDIRVFVASLQSNYMIVLWNGKRNRRKRKVRKKVGNVSRRNCERSGRKVPVLRKHHVDHEQFVTVRIEFIESMIV